MKNHQAIIVKYLVICIAICLCPASSFAVIWFDDGGIHDVNEVVTEEIQVWDNEATSKATTVNFFSDFSTNYPVKVNLKSQINVYGGKLNNVLSIYDNSTANIQGGVIKDSVDTYNNSNLIVSGGILKDISLRDNSHGEISGGVIDCDSFSPSVYVGHDSRLHLLGGEYRGIHVYGNGQLIVAGGSSTGLMSVPGGSSTGLINLVGSSVVIVHGTHFKINDEFVGIGEIDSNEFIGDFYLTCKLHSGEFLSTYFRRNRVEERIILTSDAPDSPALCLNPPSMDINNDCKVDIIDFAEFASQWMSCGLDVQEACWK